MYDLSKYDFIVVGAGLTGQQLLEDQQNSNTTTWIKLF